MEGDISKVGLPSVSRETNDRLSDYVGMIQKWNKSINLISPLSASEIWSRHILDSAQLLGHRLSDQDHWVDLGSGGGLPALVLAILAKGQALSMRFTLVESDRRKSVFLSQVVRELALPASIICSRIESVPPLKANIVSARALASLEKLCSWTHPHLHPSGRAVFPKGAKFCDEIESARRSWQFDLSEVPSITDNGAKILILENIQHA